jgi:hypothetical protein
LSIMKPLGWFAVAVIAAGIALIVSINLWRNNKDNRAIAAPGQPAADPANSAADPPPSNPPENYLNIGGVDRPRSDIEVESAQKTDVKFEDALNPNPGRTPEIDPNANPSTRSVAEAFGKKELAHRLSVLIPPPPFDRETYSKDLQTYLDTVEPGRVFQNLPYGPGVAPIERKSPYFYEVLQGETVVLEAKAEPGMPVTFYSNRLGQFANLLGTITVAADENGIARAEFKASDGTRESVEILAASPVNSGQVRYLVKINPPPAVANSTPAGGEQAKQAP